MKLAALISPGTWELVERLRPHLDVTIDLFDRTLAPLLPERRDATSQRLRLLPLGEGASDRGASTTAAGPRTRFETALRTANTQLFCLDDLWVGLFPLRHERFVVGVLAAACQLQTPHSGGGGTEIGMIGAPASPSLPPLFAGDAPPLTRGIEPLEFQRARRPIDDPVAGRIERLGWSLRGTIEADIETHQQLGDEQQQSRWLTATLQFLGQLHEGESVHELAQALVQAAAIWGDVDARVYRRDLDRTFQLVAALPALGDSVSPQRLPEALADGPGPVRIASLAELEQLGWEGPHTEVLFMPLVGDGMADWLLAVGGAVDARFERVLGVTCRTLAGRLTQLKVRQLATTRARVLDRLTMGSASLAGRIAAALAEVATAVEAPHASLLASEWADGPLRVLASVGGARLRPPSDDPDPSSTERTAERLRLPLEVGLPAPALLELETVGPRVFDAAAVALAEESAQLIGAWLAGALHGLASARYGLDISMAPGTFEDRLREEVERSRRFGLQTGLLVIDTPPASSRDRHVVALRPVIDVVRTQLRASDVLGRLRQGELAALLVHTEADGVEAVAARVRATLLAHGLTSTCVGRAAYPTTAETAEQLLEAARHDQEREATALVGAPDAFSW